MRGGKILKDECGILKISRLRRDIAAKITEKSRVTHFDFLSVACGKAPTRLLPPFPVRLCIEKRHSSSAPSASEASALEAARKIFTLFVILTFTLQTSAPKYAPMVCWS